MKKILVTGGAGFIGSHLCNAFLEMNYRVIVFDNLDQQVHPDRKIPEYLDKGVDFIMGDVRDYSKLKEAVCKSDYIFHFASAVGVGQSQYQISKYVDVNICGTANLLDILVNSRHRVRKLIVAASMSSYGEGTAKCKKCGIFKPQLRNLSEGKKIKENKYWEIKCPSCGKVAYSVPTDENSLLDSNSIYAVTKKEQEEMCLLVGRLYGIPVVSLRFFNVYGPHQSLSNPYTGVAAIFISRIKNNRRPVIFEDGLQTRDFIWVGDIVRANILALENEKANYQCFNVGTGKSISILDVAQTLIKLSGKKITPLITYRFRKGDVRHCFADTKKIRKMLGFRPDISFKKGMSELLKWSGSVCAKDRFDNVINELKKRKLV